MHNTSNGIVYSHFGDNNGDFSSYFNFYSEKNSGIIIFTNSYKFFTTHFLNELGEFLGEEIKCDISQLD